MSGEFIWSDDAEIYVEPDPPVIWDMVELEWIEGEPEVIINGGIGEDASGDFAQFGDVHLAREADETVEQFQIRARDAARVAGAETVMFGGLPPMPMDDNEGE